MSKLTFTDEERVEIVKKEYEFYTERQPVILNKSKNIIGYVAEFKDKATGEQTYVVTDKRLGENPSIIELASVKKVTLLYRGLNKSSTKIK